MLPPWNLLNTDICQFPRLAVEGFVVYLVMLALEKREQCDLEQWGKVSLRP